MSACTTFTSPLGELLLVGDESGLSALSMPGRPAVQPGRPGDAGLFTEATRQLEAYFAGDLTRFDLPFAAGGTPFQQRVWAALATASRRWARRSARTRCSSSGRATASSAPTARCAATRAASSAKCGC
jgi:hypothetical protein